MTGTTKALAHVSAAVLAGLLLSLGLVEIAQAAPPYCNSLPVPFPCGQGTHPVCTVKTACYGGTGIVPMLTSQCTQTKCVKNIGPIGTKKY